MTFLDDLSRTITTLRLHYEVGNAVCLRRVKLRLVMQPGQCREPLLP
jgi:hypothetical protein